MDGKGTLARSTLWGGLRIYIYIYMTMSILFPIRQINIGRSPRKGLLPIAYCLLPIAYCLLPIAYCLLPIAYWHCAYYCLLRIDCILPIDMYRYVCINMLNMLIDYRSCI